MSTHNASPGTPRRSLIAAAALALTVGACATTPLPHSYESRVPPRISKPQPPAIYPARGQSEAQLRRDRYECYRWAVAQSDYDPARVVARDPRPAPRVYPDPPSGVGTATGVVAGAAIGAAMSNSRHSAEGAAVGAILGGIVGAASDTAREAEARRLERELSEYDRYGSQLDSDARAYQRALGACLEGRGYSVKQEV